LEVKEEKRGAIRINPQYTSAEKKRQRTEKQQSKEEVPREIEK